MNIVVKYIKGLALAFMPRPVLFYLKAARYTRLVGRFSESDEPELKVVKHLVMRSDTVVDVGANVGWYTNYLSKLVGEGGKVISLEPMPETFALLSACIKAHGLANVQLLNVGASEADGSALMEVPQYSSGGENYYMAHIINSAQPSSAMLRREVRLRSIDSLLGEVIDKVAFIKCDVEGHELQLVSGARKLIEVAKAAWLIEVSRSSDPDLEGTNSWHIFRRFAAHGHSPWWLDGNVLRRRQKGDKTLNYFFLSSQHIDELKRSPLEVRG